MTKQYDMIAIGAGSGGVGNTFDIVIATLFEFFP
jgi:pyruvate/2-oxoglutarate dehydrogenase complex dihydrolipoamide dehydrogenase (E3) component